MATSSLRERPNPTPEERAWLAEKRFGVAVADFHRTIGERLAKSVARGLAEWGVPAERLLTVRVPGALELPRAARLLVERGMDCVVCVGAVIRGETPHFEHVARECARGIADLSRQGRAPVIFGVLTTDTAAQAETRAGGDRGDKGLAAADAAARMLLLEDGLSRVPERSPKQKPARRDRGRG